MIVTLPLPPQITQYFPEALVSFLSWFAFYTFAGLLTIPWLFCVYQLITHDVGRQKRIRRLLDDDSAPKICIVMPCYKEEPEVLLKAIDSVVDCDYPPACLHVFLSFDGDQVDDLYLETLANLGVPLPLEKYPPSIDLIYRCARITVSRFPHGGKRHCQKSTFKLIDRIYTRYVQRNDDMFILFIDSDCVLDNVCIQNFMYEMELVPGSKHNMLAMTGVITSTTKQNSLITVLQDIEYIHGQLFERSVESGCGAVTCLPGALTMLRFSAFRKMAKYYFADKAEQCADLFDYGKCHLGEDRWLTHLFMIGARQRYQIQMCTGAFCKTEAVQTYKSLLKQRRRWFLGYITNEACMLTDLRLWSRYPMLCIVRFMQNTIRTTALLFLIMIISLLTTEQAVSNLPVGFIAISLGLNWVLMFFFGAKLGRFKIWLYPLMFVVNPFFNWCYMVYGIFTAGQRTWGGPRADAAAADAQTSPQEAIEIAKAKGDDLNIVPESFKPAAEARHPERHISSAPLHPSSRVGGRFAAAEELPGGWYMHSNDSGLTLRSTPIDTEMHGRQLGLRDSAPDYSLYMPKTLEQIMSEEDQHKWYLAQAASRNASGLNFLETLPVHDPRADLGNCYGYHEGYNRVYEVSDQDSDDEYYKRTAEYPKYSNERSPSIISPEDPFLDSYEIQSPSQSIQPIHQTVAPEYQRLGVPSAPSHPYSPSPDMSEPIIHRTSLDLPLASPTPLRPAQLPLSGLTPATWLHGAGTQPSSPREWVNEGDDSDPLMMGSHAEDTDDDKGPEGVRKEEVRETEHPALPSYAPLFHQSSPNLDFDPPHPLPLRNLSSEEHTHQPPPSPHSPTITPPPPPGYRLYGLPAVQQYRPVTSSSLAHELSIDDYEDVELSNHEREERGYEGEDEDEERTQLQTRTARVSQMPLLRSWQGSGREEETLEPRALSLSLEGQEQQHRREQEHDGEVEGLLEPERLRERRRDTREAQSSSQAISSNNGKSGKWWQVRRKLQKKGGK